MELVLFFLAASIWEHNKRKKTPSNLQDEVISNMDLPIFPLAEMDLNFSCKRNNLAAKKPADIVVWYD